MGVPARTAPVGRPLCGTWARLQDFEVIEGPHHGTLAYTPTCFLDLNYEPLIEYVRFFRVKKVHTDPRVQGLH